MRRITAVSVLVVAGLLVGVTGSSVAAATETTVTWKVSSLNLGQVTRLSAVASTNSPGVKTWSKEGWCSLTPKNKPTKFTMGAGDWCTLTLKIAKSGNYPAKTSTLTFKKDYCEDENDIYCSQRLTVQLISNTTPTTPTPTTSTTVPALACAQGGACALGDIGPGGGTIFYVDLNREAGSRYFEAACAGWRNYCDGTTADPLAGWGCGKRYVGSAGETEIGLGEENTAIIVAQCVDAGTAAKLAARYSRNTLDDWFLPSRDELFELYRRRASVGGLTFPYYWSSSETTNWRSAYFLDYYFGIQASSKGSLRFVRPIRSF